MRGITGKQPFLLRSRLSTPPWDGSFFTIIYGCLSRLNSFAVHCYVWVHTLVWIVEFVFFCITDFQHLLLHETIASSMCRPSDLASLACLHHHPEPRLRRQFQRPLLIRCSLIRCRRLLPLLRSSSRHCFMEDSVVFTAVHTKQPQHSRTGGTSEDMLVAASIVGRHTALTVRRLTIRYGVRITFVILLTFCPVLESWQSQLAWSCCKR